MGGKHLKKLRAEKSKVKLKQKKILPKGQNVTNTSFKVKKIVTYEQLKKVDEDVPVSSWNVPLKDLLVRLNHYNFNSRLNALTGIKELITNYPEILQGPSLRPTVIRIIELITDPASKIRATAVNLTNFIFSLLPSKSIVPFHDIMIAHLSCAMTHRDIEIQQDSLKFIDIIITYAPDAVPKNFENLFKNFARIIRIYFYGARSEVSVSKGSKQDLGKTRTDMFHKFYQILAAGYLVSDNEPKSEEIVQVKSSIQRFPIKGLCNQYKKIPDLSFIFKKPREGGSVTLKSEASEFQSQSEIIMPLLFDTWTEFAPNRLTDGFISEFVLNENTAGLLLVILKTILLMYERVMSFKNPGLESWFVATYSSQFKKSFTVNFPYMPSNYSKKLELNANGDSPNVGSNAYMLQNLIICYLTHCLRLKYKNNDLDGKMERFVSNALLVKNPQGPEILAKLVEAIINYPKNKKSDLIITTIIKSYNTTNSVELRRRLFKILMKVALEEKYVAYQGNQNLLKWMKTLPSRLLKPRIPFYVIETISKLVSRPIGAELLKEVEKKAVNILEYLQHAKIEGSDQIEGQKIMANIIYWCSNDVLEEVVKKGILQKGSYPHELRSYIIDIFSHKLTGQTNVVSQSLCNSNAQ